MSPFLGVAESCRRGLCAAVSHPGILSITLPETVPGQGLKCHKMAGSGCAFTLTVLGRVRRGSSDEPTSPA